MKRVKKYGKALWVSMPGVVLRKTPTQRRRTRLRQYSKLAHGFITDALLDPVRQWCPVAETVFGAKRLVSQVHHTRGRRGDLLLNQKYWMPVSDIGHRFIHDNIDMARVAGWLAEKGEWNKQP